MKHSPAFLKLVDGARAGIREVTPEQVRQRQEAGDDFVLVDVREDNEWEKGRARGSIHLGRGILERDVEARFPDPDTDLVLYCGGGFRSALSAESLVKMGYRRVSSMDGGWKRWNELGYPVEEGP